MEKNVNIKNSWFLPLLTLVFIVLKLCQVIEWSWWWVLAPMWIPYGIIFISLGILFIIKKCRT